MIYYLEGILKEKKPSRIIVEVRGIGYEIFIPFSIFEKLPEPGKRIKVYTYLHTRDEKNSLYGFLDPGDREFFLDLTSISSVGPRSALKMLTRISPSEFKEAINQKDLDRLTSVPGIGKKTAQRLILEMGGVIKEREIPEAKERTIFKDGVMGLISLGYSKSEAERAVRRALKDGKTKKKDLASLIKEALKYV